MMLQCPKCKSDKGLEISCTQRVDVFVDKDGEVTGSREPGDGYNWDDHTAASCSQCDWDGTVKDLKNMSDDELSKLPLNIQRLVTASDRLTRAINEWRRCGIPDYREILDATELVDSAVVAIAYEAHDDMLRKEKEG